MELVVISIEQLRSIIHEEIQLAMKQRAGPSNEKRYLSVKELSTHLRISVPSIYKKVADDEIPHHNINSRILFERSEIDAWVAKK